MMVMMMMKVIYCRLAYDIIRVLFNEMCGNIVDAGNAIWFGLAMYAASAVFMFFFALQLVHAVRTSDNRIRPRRNAAIVDLDMPTPPPKLQELVNTDVNWRRRPTISYRLPGKTHGHWLQEPDERQRRRNIKT